MPATRALAASAGLPVFASVAEYESSLVGLEDEQPSGTAASGRRRPWPGHSPTPARGTPAQPVGSAGSDGTLGLVVAGGGRGSHGRRRRGGAAGSGASSAIPIAPPGDTIRTPVPRDPSSIDGERPVELALGSATGSRTGVVAAAGGRSRVRTPWLVGGAILALAVLVAGVGIYLLLPSAAISVTPRQEPVGPIDITVTADTTASGPDASALVVPAQQVPVPVSVSDTFNATGKRVALTNATGNVRFQNLDPTSTNRIAAGSIVRTNSGVRFRTAATVTVPRAELITIGTQITLTPGRIVVKVTAVDGGPDGNVDAGTIVIVPSGENSLFLKVSNPEPTTGGTSQEFTRVTQADVDGALAALNVSLAEAFTEAMADPALAAERADRLSGDREPGPDDPDRRSGDARRPGGPDLRPRPVGHRDGHRRRLRRRSAGSPNRRSRPRSSPTTSWSPDPST